MSLAQNAPAIHPAAQALRARLDMIQQFAAEISLLAALLRHPDQLGEALDAVHPPADEPWSDDVIALGPAQNREEAFDDASGYEPTDQDIQAMLDLEERYQTERNLGINARFAP